MGNSLRCCLACVLPCGALDVIRIVHINGVVEELTRPTSAGDILKANPNHVLTKPTSQGMVHRILILSPESDLKRGHIYFLIPSSSVPEKKKKKKKIGTQRSANKKSVHRRQPSGGILPEVADDHYLTEILSEKKSASRRDRRSGRVNIWRPHLDSITEDSS